MSKKKKDEEKKWRDPALPTKAETMRAYAKPTKSSTTTKNSPQSPQKVSQGTSSKGTTTNYSGRGSRGDRGSSAKTGNITSSRGNQNATNFRTFSSRRENQRNDRRYSPTRRNDRRTSTTRPTTQYSKNTASKTKDTKVERVFRGATNQWAGGQLSSIGTSLQSAETTARSYRNAKYEGDDRNYSLRSRQEAERTNASRTKNIGLKEGINTRKAERTYEYDPNGLSQKLIRKGDELIESGTKDIEKAKEGTGKLGSLAIDIGSNAVQMAGDSLFRAIPVVGQAMGMASLMNRAGGTASYEARQMGMNPDQQATYQQGTALIEGLSEGIFNSVSAFRATYGKGAFSLADRVSTSKAANQIVQNLFKSDLGQSLAINMARLGTEMFEEGFEELVADVAEPALKYTLMKSTDPKYQFEGYDPKTMAYDFLVGALMAGMPGAVDVGRSVRADVTSKAYSDGQAYATELINRGMAQGRITEEGTEAKKSDAEILARNLQEQQAQGLKVLPANMKILERAVNESSEANARAFENRSAENEQRALQEERLAPSTNTLAEETAYQKGENAVEDRNTQTVKERMGENISEKSARAVGRVLTGTATNDDIETILINPEARRATEELALNKGETLSVNTAKARDTLENVISMNEIANKDTIRKEVQTAHANEIAEEINMSKRGGKLFAENYAEAVEAIGSPKVYEEVFTRLYTDGTIKGSDFEDSYERIVAPLGNRVTGYFTKDVALKAYQAGQMASIVESGKASVKEKAIRDMGAGITVDDDATGYVSERVQKDLAKFAQRANVHIHIVKTMSKTLKDGTKLSANGRYHNGVIYIAADADNKLITVAKHELTHHIKKFSPERYKELEDFVFEKWYKSNKEAMEDAIRRKQLLYRDISVEEAKEEIIADASEAFFTDETAVQEAVTFSEKLGRAIRDGIHALLDTFTSLDSSQKYAKDGEEGYKYRGYGEFLKELDILRDAEKMWINALEGTMGENAVVAEDYTDATEQYDPTDSSFSLVTDKNLIRELEADKHMTTYRAMALIDGKLYPPMATKVKDENGKWTLQQGMNLGQWIESDINTDSRMFDKEGKFLLQKDSGNKPLHVAYNPYIHSSDTMLNDQFAIAYKRPNIVVVEGDIPVSELNSGYRAEHDLDDGRHIKAKDTTGKLQWKAGVVQSNLTGTRTVFLTNHFKPTRVVPDSEVAKNIQGMLEGTDVAIPYNVVTPSVRKELLKLGVKMEQSKQKGFQVDLNEDSAELTKALKENGLEKMEQPPKFSLKEGKDNQGNDLTEGQKKFFKDSKATDENGHLAVVYHTTDKGGFTVFDPKYSDDRRSLFFASNFDISQTYSYDGEKSIDVNMEKPFKTYDEFKAFADENFEDIGWNPNEDIIDNIKLVLHRGVGEAGRKSRITDRTTLEAWLNEELPNMEDYWAEATSPSEWAGQWKGVDGIDPSDLLESISGVLGRREGAQSGYYECYLNLQNPLVVNGRGDSWHDIRYSDSAQIENMTAYKFNELYVMFGDYNKEGAPTRLYFQIEGERKNGENYEPYEVLKQFNLPTNLTKEDLRFDDERGILIDQLYDYWENKMGFQESSLKELSEEEADFDGELRIKKDKPIRLDSKGNRVYETEESYSTRDLAEMAEKSGYDGVIIRDIRDIGGASRLKSGASPYSDIYVAFNSNQVKLASNENPTEDEDIRYSVKQKQFDIIQKANPMLDGYHTGIRDVSDIKDAWEAFKEKGFVSSPDWTFEDAQKALDKGKVTVFSSKPIADGTFVTPSMMEAQSYAGDGNFYQAEVPLEDIAWVDAIEGQYAKVSGEEIDSEAKFSIKLMNHPAPKPAIDKGGKEVGSRVIRNRDGSPMLMSGFEVTADTLRMMGKESEIPTTRIFLNAMAKMMEKMGEKYTYIGLNDVMNADLEVRRDKDGNPVSIVVSAMVKNGEYPINFDFSSICKKRQAMSKLFEKLSTGENGDFLDSVELTVDNLWEINEILSKNGFETACLGCFVETKRYGIENWADTFVEKWNKAVRESNPNATYFSFSTKTDIDYGYVSDEIEKFAENKKSERNKESQRRKRERTNWKKKWMKDNPSGTEADAEKAFKDWWKKKYNKKAADYKESWFETPALSNDKAILSLVNSGKKMQKLLRKTDLISPKGLKALMALHPDFYGVLYGHFGSGTPKPMVSFTPYNSELALLDRQLNPNGGLKKYTTEANEKMVNKLKSIGGVRVQSFSDFLIQNTFDYIQMVCDMSARNFPAHAYTKEIAFAKIFGLTGMKINLSVMFDVDPEGIAPGLDKYGNYVVADKARQEREKANGKHVFSFSISFDEARELQNKEGYDGNIGIIGVGLSDMHIRKMLNDPDIKMVIPYHSSSMPTIIKQRTGLGADSDYTSTQNTLNITKITRDGKDVTKQYGKEYMLDLYKKKGSWKEAFRQFRKDTEGCEITTEKAFESIGDFPLYTGDSVMSLDATNDPKLTAEYYMGWCIEQGHFPLFYQFADEENYFKVLYDFNVYKSDGTYAPQNAVTNTYPEELESIVDQYMNEANDFEKEQMPRWDKTIDETKEMLKRNSYNGEGSFSVKESNLGYHAGDLGKSVGDDYFGQGYYRGTGHFGFGTYFVGDKINLEGTGLEGRPVETVDFDNYNLYKPRNYDTGARLHDALKIVDGFAKRYSEFSKYKGLGNWDERYYKTNGIINDIGDYIFELQDRDKTPDPEVKERIDKYISEMPETYRDRIDEEARKRYEKAQSRRDDEQSVRRNLEGQYDRVWANTDYYDSKEAYVDSHLENELSWIREEKEATLDEWKYFAAEDIIKEYVEEWESDLNVVNRLVGELQMGLGFQKRETEIENALKETERIVNGYRQGRRGLDSAATVFMKQLGYEGVDVRGIRGLDNTTYGSVIYDLKGEDLARKKEIGTARYSLKESSYTPTAQTTIAKLEEKVADLKSEFKRTNLKTADPKQVRVEAGRLIRRHDSNLAIQPKVVKAMNDIFTLYKEKGDDAFKEAEQIAKETAKEIVDKMYYIQQENEAAKETMDNIKAYLRNNPVVVTEQMKRSITDWGDFYRKNFGRIKMGKGLETNIDQTYWARLAEFDPEYFTPDYAEPASMLEHIADYFDEYSYMHQDYEMSTEEMQDYVVEIASDIMWTAYDLRTKKTFADKKYLEKEAAVKKAREKALASRKKALGEQKKRYEKKLDFLKQKHQDYKADTRENAEKKRRIKQISNVYKRLLEKLQTPTDTKHLPDDYAPVVTKVLSLFDFTTPGMEKWAERNGEPSKRHKYMTNTMLELRKQLEQMSKDEGSELEVDTDLLDLIDEIMADMEDGQRLIDMDSKTLEDISVLFRAFEHQLNSYNKAFDEANKKAISDTAHSIFDDLDGMKKSKWKLGIMGRFLTSNFNPSDFFELVGGDIADLYNATRLGFDKYVDRLDNAKTFLQDRVDNKKADKWANHVETYKTSDGEEIQLTDTQLMSLYCLNKREQAQGHIYVGGIVSAPLKVKGKLTTRELEKSRVHPTLEDMGKWLNTLTDEQKEIADSIQKYFVDEVSEWGNETSMKLYNYKKFGEQNYFPIQSDKDYMASNFDQKGDDPVLKNMGMTKALTKKASNVIVVDDIFTVYSKHVAQMASYNAYVPAITDFQRVWNYTEGNDQDMVKARFEDIYGKNAADYIDNFFKNLNGVYKANFDPTILDKGLGLFKKAAVGGNIRVLVQQPTAIARASLIINPAYLTAAVPLATARPKATYKEMMDHCPIARWKTWGFYSSDITSASRDLKNIMIGKEALTDKIFMDMYGTADNVTWTVIFKACELQVEAQNKGLEKGSDEYWEKVNELASRVFDRTQVVDSPFHRSEIMKSQNGITKMATAFMAEPTKTINMINTELTKAMTELKNGHPAKATGIFVRVGAVITANAAALAVAQAMVDAMRHAGGDDDKDKGDYKDRFKNYWKSNFTDNLNPLGMIPYIKDVKSIWDGYDVVRMDMTGVTKLINSIRYLQKYYEDPGASKYSAQEEWTNLALQTFYAAGIPVANAKRDIEGLYVTIMEGTGHPEVFFHQAKRKYQLNDKTKGSFTDMYYDALARRDNATAREIYNYLLRNGVTADYIKKRKATYDKHKKAESGK